MPGIALTSSAAVRRPPVRLEIVPPVATSFTRGSGVVEAGCGAGCALALAATAMLTMTRNARLFGRRAEIGMERIQIPVKESPHPVPRVALLARVLGLPRLRIDAAVEGVTAGRVVVDHRLGQLRLARSQGVD